MTQDLRTSVFQIRDDYGNVHGTGFIVDANTGVTCAHVVQAAGATQGETVTISFALSAAVCLAEVLPHAWRPPEGDDIAFLRLQNELPTDVKPAILGPSGDMAGHSFRAFGYPKVGDLQGVFATGEILDLITDSQGIKMLQLDSQQIAQGMSGAPVLDKKADRVVGMITATYYPPEGSAKFRDAAFATPIEVAAKVWPSLVLIPPSLSLWEKTQRLPIGVKLLLIGLLLITIFGLSLGSNVWSTQVAAVLFPTNTLTPTSTPTITATPTVTPTPTPSPIPPMDEDDFNIAVAQFTMTDQAGELNVTPLTERLSNALFNIIEDKTSRSDNKIAVRKPDEVGAISEHDLPNQSVGAEHYADQNNVDVLIYGLVIPTDNGVRLEPKFHIGRRGFEYAEEITGLNWLGQTIFVEQQLIDNPSNKQLETKLNTISQVAVLEQLVLGLVDFYYSEYNLAWGKFFLAEQLVNDSGVITGQEIIHLLKGTAKLRLYGPKLPPAQKVSLLQEARASYEEAVRLNDGYARSYLGLAAVLFEEAKLNQPIDDAKLDEAEKLYEQAIYASNQPDSAYIPAKAKFGLGQIYRERYNPGHPNGPGTIALSYLEEVIDTYNETPTADLARFAGHAYAMIGWIEGNHGKWDAAAQNCKESIKVLERMSSPPRGWIAYYWTCVAQAKEQLNHIEDALDAYDQAILNGEVAIISERNVIDDEDLALWESERKRLEKLIAK